MSTPSRSLFTHWRAAMLLTSLVCAGFLVAREAGWLESIAWLKHKRLAHHARYQEEADDELSESDDPDDFELPPSTILAESDPDQDDLDNTSSPSLPDSRIATIGFDEEPPPGSAFPEDGADFENDSAAAKAVVAGRQGDTSKAVSPVGTARPLMDKKRIQNLIDEGDYVVAQKELSTWYWQVPAEREKLLPQLNKMAQAVYFSPQPHYYEPYIVKAGDQLRIVGQRYKLSWEYISKVNRVDARKVRMGQKLKVAPGPFAAAIFVDRYELVIHLNGSFVKGYPVGLGKDGTTPIGAFTVKNKMVDPTYYGPEGVIAHDDPNNPLGERWIDIGDGFGIHGTIDPESIGKNESRGCIRMLNADVEEVYDFLVIGSEVKILP